MTGERLVTQGQQSALANNTRFCIETGVHGHYCQRMDQWAENLRRNLGPDYPALVPLGRIATAELPYGLYLKKDEGELGVVRVDSQSGKEFVVEMSGDSRIAIFTVDDEGGLVESGDNTDEFDRAIYDRMLVLLDEQEATGLVYNPDIL